MICTYCGTELPEGALFCGECGRAVTPAAKKIARVQVPNVLPATRVVPEQQADVAPEAETDANWHWGDSGTLRCQQCGAPMEADEIFCGECGAVSKSAAHHFGRPRDTAIIERIEPEESFEPESESQPEPEQAPAAEPVQAPAPVRTQAPTVAPPSPTDVPFAELDALEATRIVSRGAAGERFVLQFSTGESSTVHGTGLIGRNPAAEPGEYFDQLVRVIDPSRSVSKTHLEFGQEGGAFWVMDRFSGNGTVLKEPDSAPIRCLPERRYRIVRGTRVEMGEQFFIVS